MRAGDGTQRAEFGHEDDSGLVAAGAGGLGLGRAFGGVENGEMKQQLAATVTAKRNG